jgi:acetoin utilization deacetylase AcuC-like enzyme
MVGIHLGGGWHHAFPDHGEGFCVLNDMACAIRTLQTTGIQRILIVDCDLHQGNGNAYIFRNDPKVFTFSIHQQHLYPLAKPKSDLDIGLEAGISDEKYLNLLESNVPQILENFKPEFILYQAGADPYKDDRLGNLNLSIEGLNQRDEFIRDLAIKQDIPLALTLGGGYAYKLEDTVQIHFNTVKVFLK